MQALPTYLQMRTYLKDRNSVISGLSFLTIQLYLVLRARMFPYPWYHWKKERDQRQRHIGPRSQNGCFFYGEPCDAQSFFGSGSLQSAGLGSRLTVLGVQSLRAPVLLAGEDRLALHCCLGSQITSEEPGWPDWVYSSYAGAITPKTVLHRSVSGAALNEREAGRIGGQGRSFSSTLTSIPVCQTE